MSSNISQYLHASDQIHLLLSCICYFFCSLLAEYALKLSINFDKFWEVQACERNNSTDFGGYLDPDPGILLHGPSVSFAVIHYVNARYLNSLSPV